MFFLRSIFHAASRIEPDQNQGQCSASTGM